MVGNTTGHYDEDYMAPDSRYKIIMVLLGFSREWPYKHGLLRIFRSADRGERAFESTPEFARMLMFRVSEHS